jgi:hypothetical protein
MDQLVFLLALHAGVQATGFDGDESQYIGPRLEAEALLQPKSWFAIGLVGSYSHASDRGPEPDVIDGPDYEMTEATTFASVGARAYLQSSYVFLGVGLWNTWDRYAYSAKGATSIHWDRFSTPELVVGSNVAHIGDYRVRVMVDAAWSRLVSLDDVIEISFMVGVQRVVRP